MDFNYTQHLINISASLQRIIVGGSFAIIIGITLGILRYLLPRFIKKNVIFNFICDAIKFPPPIAWIPFVVLWVGIGDKSSWLIVFIGVFPSVFTQTYESLNNIKADYLQTLRSLGWPLRKKIFKFYIPAILPQLFIGIKVGLGMGWMSIIAAEMISGVSGLGYSIQLGRINLQYQQMLIDISSIAVIGFMIQFTIDSIQRRVIKWQI